MCKKTKPLRDLRRTIIHLRLPLHSRMEARLLKVIITSIDLTYLIMLVPRRCCHHLSLRQRVPKIAKQAFRVRRVAGIRGCQVSARNLHLLRTLHPMALYLQLCQRRKKPRVLHMNSLIHSALHLRLVRKSPRSKKPLQLQIHNLPNLGTHLFFKVRYGVCHPAALGTWER